MQDFIKLLRLSNAFNMPNKSLATKAASAITYKEKRELYGDLFPTKLLTKKTNTPSNLYIANAATAAKISKSLKPYLQQAETNTLLEINPGIGLLTRKLLQEQPQFEKLLLVESNDYFMPKLKQLQAFHEQRVSIRQGDFVQLWKLAYQDKLDNGNRVQSIFEDVPIKAMDDDPNMIVVGAAGSYQFFKHLINSIIFQYGLFSWGRCEMYIVMPPPIYVHLTCLKDIGYMIYRSTSMLFQMLFEYHFITKLPREHFLPTQVEYNFVKGSKLRRVRSINPEYLYLVKIVPRRNIFDLCAVHDLPALWYFVKQNCVSRRNRIIPNLEKWIPGCGTHLILSKDSQANISFLYADENEQMLPSYSSRCSSMSTQDYFPNMNIYTQFGDLTPSQMLTLFTQFRQWPEYGQSSFLASLENSLLKMEEAAADDSIDVIIGEEDDVNSELNIVDEDVKQLEKTEDVK